MPGIILLIMVLSKHTMMPDLYGIRSNEMGYYLAFALVIIPFSLIMDVFVLNTQEVRYRTATRESCLIVGETFWVPIYQDDAMQATVLLGF